MSLTHALAETEHDSEGTGKLLKAIAAGALDLVPTFSPAQLASLLASFSHLRHYDEPMYRAIARQAAPAVHLLEPQQRSDLLHALAIVVRTCTSSPFLTISLFLLMPVMCTWTSVPFLKLSEIFYSTPCLTCTSGSERR